MIIEYHDKSQFSDGSTQIPTQNPLPTGSRGFWEPRGPIFCFLNNLCNTPNIFSAASSVHSPRDASRPHKTATIGRGAQVTVKLG